MVHIILKAFPVTVLLVLFHVALARVGNCRWESLGPEGGRINVLVPDPVTRETLYAGTAYGGIFKTTSGADKWSPINSGLVGRSIEVLAIAPGDPLVLYTSTEDGLFKTTTGGNEWIRVGPPVNCLAIDPQSPQTIYAGNSEGIVKSTDGGNAWFPVNIETLGINDRRNFYIKKASAIAIEPTTPQTVYAGFEGGALLKSTDGGSSWSVLRKTTNYYSPVKSIAIDSMSPQIIYVAANDGVFKSINGGRDWTPLQHFEKHLQVPVDYDGNIDEAKAEETYEDALKRVELLKIDPQTPSVIYAAGNRIHRSIDGGMSWGEIKTGIEYSNIGALAIDPHMLQTLYAGSRFGGGVVKSLDAGKNWTRANPGLTATDVYDLAAAPDFSELYAASDDGVLKKPVDSRGWASINSGIQYTEIQVLAADPNSQKTLYAGTFAGGIYKSIDGGDNWNPLNIEPPSAGTSIYDLIAINPVPVFSIVMDPLAPQTVYMANGKGVFKSTNGGDTWKRMDAPFSGHLTLDPVTPQRLYGSSWKGIHASKDGGKSWKLIKKDFTALSKKTPKDRNRRDWPAGPGLRAPAISIAIDPTSPQTIYAGTHGKTDPPAPYFEGGVFKSIDGGKNWQAVTVGLPDVDISALLIDPQKPQTIYAGTSDGKLFKSINGARSWSAIDTPFSGNGIRKLQISHRVKTAVYVGTDGMGVFRYVDADEPR